MAETSDQFLVVRLTSLGDLVHTIPAVAALRATFPAATIDWVVDERYLSLIRMVTCINEAIPLGRSISSVFHCVGRLRRGNYTCALELQGTFRSAVLAWLSGIHRRIGRTREATREQGAELFYTDRVNPTGRHIVDMTVALAAAAGARPQPEPQFPLRVPEAALREMREQLAREGITGDYVVIAGQAGIRDHIHIGAGAVIGAKAGVAHDVADGERMLGAPATPEREQKRILLSLEKLPEIRREIREIKHKLGIREAG